MVRPRWHDAAIIVAIAALLATGVWALWWDDVRDWLWPRSHQPEPTEPTDPGIAGGQQT
jgi:hypothetical protein